MRSLYLKIMLLLIWICKSLWDFLCLKTLVKQKERYDEQYQIGAITKPAEKTGEILLTFDLLKYTIILTKHRKEEERMSELKHYLKGNGTREVP